MDISVKKIKKERCSVRLSGGLTYLTLIIPLTLWAANSRAGDKLDMSFIQGGSLNKDAWIALNSKYAPGRYLVDVSLNGKELGKKILDITLEDTDEICLPGEWLTKAGIHLRADYFENGHNVNRQCYVLEKSQASKADFDVSTQSLALSVPQRGLLSQDENVNWDYGASAMRMNYNVNTSKGRNNNTTFGSADLKANAGRWVVSSAASASNGSGGSNASISMFTASRAIQALKADLLLGKTQVGTGLLGSTSTYGATLSRNNSMQPGNLGYSPVFSGIADSMARVTLTQGSSTLYSQMVPAGPFSITNVNLYSSGDVTMSVTEEDGRIHRQIFPVSVINGQLSPGQHEFGISVGMPDDSSRLQGGLLSSSYGYGLNNLTLRAGTALNHHYHGAMAGVVTGLGPLGALSTEGAWAQAKYQRQAKLSGSKVQLAWSKQLETTGTGLRLSWSRALTEEFPALSSFDPQELWQDDGKNFNLRDEWNMGISQPVGGRFSTSLTAWQRSFYHKSGRDSGLSGSLNTQIQNVSLSAALSQSKSADGESHWTISTSVSVPFTLFDRRYSSSTSVSKSKGTGAGISSGMSGSLNDRFSYGLSANRDGNGGFSSSFNSSYSGDRAIVGGNLSQSSSGETSGSASLSGSLLAVPAARSVMLSNTSSDTVAVISVKNTPGVKVVSGQGRTNANGHLVVPLNSYDQNTITIDAGGLPLDTELGTTSLKVVPASQAVIWMPFDALKVHRYLLQVTQSDGTFVNGGTWARDEKGMPLGFVAANGVLMLNTVDIPKKITLGGCLIAEGVLKLTEKLQQVRCENEIKTEGEGL